MSFRGLDGQSERERTSLVFTTLEEHVPMESGNR